MLTDPRNEVGLPEATAVKAPAQAPAPAPAPASVEPVRPEPGDPEPGRSRPSHRVLLDAHNRDLEQGTGISTYSRLLGEALTALGHEPSWLFARAAPRNADDLTREVAFFDLRDPPVGRIGAVVRAVGQMAGGLLPGAVEARYMPASSTVIRDPLRPYEPRAYNAERVYDRAHQRHALRGEFLPLKIDRPVDILHLTAPLPIRMRGVRTVCTIHDLIPIRLPYTTLDNKREFIRRLRKSVAYSDLILTVSESSRNDIISVLGADPDKVAVTYQSSDLKPFRASERSALPRVLARYGLEPQRFILFVSAIEPKKNLRRVIDAYLEIDTNIPLVIAGKRAWMWQREIGDLEGAVGSKMMRRLRFLGYVPRNDLRYLYSGAQFLAFPSLYEGFGLPALEAMMFGCPVLTSNVSSLPEICGDAAIYVDPFDPDDIREKMDRLLQERDLRAWLSQAGLQQAQTFTFDRYVERLAAAYAKLDATHS